MPSRDGAKERGKKLKEIGFEGRGMVTFVVE